jgi:hypothetical protein
MEHSVLIVEEIRLKERYKTLSELWEPNSKHRTHTKISKEMDKVLDRLKEIKKILAS